MRDLLRKLPWPIGALFFCIGLIIFLGLGSVMFLIWRKELIHDAARRGDVQAVEKMLDRHPQWIENRSRLDLTPLLEAAWADQTSVLEVLICRGADVHAVWNLPKTGEAKWTALHICGIQGRVKAAEVLLRAGADVNARSLKGITPLDVARQNGNTELAGLLSSRGGVSGADLPPVP